MNIPQYRDLIIKKLAPLINDKVALLETPHYFNIGDILIWKGELEFLTSIGRKIVYSTSSYNYDETKTLSKDTTILLQGGGNWGDIWDEPHIFRKKIIAQYPNNSIVVFPQTLYYKKEENLKNDADFYSRYPKVTICARDKQSYHILQTYFPNNNILLLPDMAFFIDIDEKTKSKKGEKILFAKRVDKELADNIDYSFIPQEAEKHDWPTFEEGYFTTPTLGRCTKRLRAIDSIFHSKLTQKYIDYYWAHNRMPMLFEVGKNFLKEYQTIYTTRLHIGILGMLMGKEVYLLDNNYGKLNHFYEAWLNEIDNVHLIKA